MAEQGVRVGPLLLRASAVLAIALFAGRIAGFARELILASTLGVTESADVAILLLTLPDLLVNLLLSGGLSVALIPLFRAWEVDRAQALLRQSVLLIAVVFSLLAAALAWQPEVWLAILAPGVRLAADGAWREGVWQVALAVPLTALAGVSTAWLNARDKFFVAGCGTLLFNVCVIAALVWGFDSADSLSWLCLGILAGAAVRLASQWSTLPVGMWRPRPGPWLVDRTLVRSFATALLAASLMLLVPVVVRALASLLGGGTIAAFNYATKLVELPVGILITTIATVAFPRLAQLHAIGHRDAVLDDLSACLRRATLLSIAVVASGWWFADAVVALLFQRGRVDAEAVSQVTALTRTLFGSVPFIGVATLATAGLNAQGRTGTVLRLTLVCLVALPVLGAPGLLWRSPVALASGLVLFHVLLSLMLLRELGLPWLGVQGWMDRRMAMASAWLLVVAALFALGDMALGWSDPRLRSALAVLMFGTMAAFGIRFQLKSRAANNEAASQ